MSHGVGRETLDVVVFVLLLVLIIIQVTVFSPCNGIIEDYEVKVIFEEWKLI